ncbi:MAG: type II toxin-antitoxin system VapC family toxin [Xanthomonadaceae bacterium]|nr:type II toxin-antitoxin system VapC family toxin [Xanthomonadaceae bacterium]
MTTRRTAMYLIDTNVVSELAKTRGEPGVLAFIAGAAAADEPVYLSVISIGEIEYGIARLLRRGDTAQAERYATWANALRERFADHTLDIDVDVAALWGRLRAVDSQHPVDKLIAATALVYDLTVVTRDERDFRGTGARVHNPFA